MSFTCQVLVVLDTKFEDTLASNDTLAEMSYFATLSSGQVVGVTRDREGYFDRYTGDRYEAIDFMELRQLVTVELPFDPVFKNQS